MEMHCSGALEKKKLWEHPIGNVPRGSEQLATDNAKSTAQAEQHGHNVHAKAGMHWLTTIDTRTHFTLTTRSSGIARKLTIFGSMHTWTDFAAIGSPSIYHANLPGPMCVGVWLPGSPARV
eukprot:scpid38391/ scgid15117/ 